MFIMRNSWIDNRIEYKFRSIPTVLIHFTISLLQLLSALAILALQIWSVTTQTCVYQIGVGFWSMPFLLLSSISIWIVLWRRTSIACFLAIVTHLIATLFATSVIIISFLTLLGQIECSRSTLTMYYIPLNSSLIGIAGVFKILNYYELILLYRLRQNTEEIPTTLPKDLHHQHSPVLLNSTRTTATWDSWSTFSIISLLDDRVV